MIAEMRRLEALYRRGIITKEMMFDKLVRDCQQQPFGEVLPYLPPEILGPFREWISGISATEGVYRLGGGLMTGQELATIRAIRDWFAEDDRSGRIELAAEVPQR